MLWKISQMTEYILRYLIISSISPSLQWMCIFILSKFTSTYALCERFWFLLWFLLFIRPVQRFLPHFIWKYFWSLAQANRRPQQSEWEKSWTSCSLFSSEFSLCFLTELNLTWERRTPVSVQFVYLRLLKPWNNVDFIAHHLHKIILRKDLNTVSIDRQNNYRDQKLLVYRLLSFLLSQIWKKNLIITGESNSYSCSHLQPRPMWNPQKSLYYINSCVLLNPLIIQSLFKSLTQDGWLCLQRITFTRDKHVNSSVTCLY